jgi:hypothetical protein
MRFHIQVVTVLLCWVLLVTIKDSGMQWAAITATSDAMSCPENGTLLFFELVSELSVAMMLLMCAPAFSKFVLSRTFVLRRSRHVSTVSTVSPGAQGTLGWLL